MNIKHYKPIAKWVLIKILETIIILRKRKTLLTGLINPDICRKGHKKLDWKPENPKNLTVPLVRNATHILYIMGWESGRAIKVFTNLLMKHCILPYVKVRVSIELARSGPARNSQNPARKNIGPIFQNLTQPKKNYRAFCIFRDY